MLDEGVPMPFAREGVFRVKGGEGVKRWAELERILGWLAAHQAERSRPLIVIGGGAVLDLGALAASLYRRGVPLILVPTTLLGMVDATLGGKTAVDGEIDGRFLKNFAGTFYPADRVWICPEFLATLPKRERVSGAGEVYKSLWLKGGQWNTKALARYVETGEPSAGLTKVIRTSLELKSRFVRRDPLDTKRVREALNFGHTVGHALESLSDLSHGECVLWGMAVESTLLKKCSVPWAEALRGLELPQQFATEAGWAEALTADKKNKNGEIEMSLVERPGKIVKRKFAPAEIVSAIRAFPEFYRRA